MIEAGVRPRAGDSALVTGAGGSIGRAAVPALIEAGAIPIASIRASRRDSVGDLPVAAVNLGDAAPLAAAGPFDAIADKVGGDTLAACLALVKPRANVASVAVPARMPGEETDQRFSTIVVRFDAQRLERFMAGVATGGWRIPVAQRLPLQDAALAHRLVEAGGTRGKILPCP